MTTPVPILVDTNVISEFMKPQIDEAVQRWAEEIEAGQLKLSVVSVQEIEYGIGRLAEGRRRDRLGEVWGSLLQDFGSSVLAYDRAAALRTAQVLVEADASGHPMSLADAQIAGTCLAYGCVLATRNVTDFDALAELAIVNPFQRP